MGVKREREREREGGGRMAVGKVIQTHHPVRVGCINHAASHKNVRSQSPGADVLLIMVKQQNSGILLCILCPIGLVKFVCCGGLATTTGIR